MKKNVVKKLLAGALASAMILGSLAGCGGGTGDNAGGQKTQEASASWVLLCIWRAHPAGRRGTFSPKCFGSGFTRHHRASLSRAKISRQRLNSSCW